MTLQQRLVELREQARYSIRNSALGLRLDPALVLALLDVAEAAAEDLETRFHRDWRAERLPNTLSALEGSLDNG